MRAASGPALGFRFLLFAPVVWAAQFLAGYVIAAIHCEKFADAAMGNTRMLIAAIAMVSLLLIVFHGLRSAAIHRRCASSELAGRQRFIAFAGLLLCVVSGIATVFGVLPVLMLESCR